MPNLYDLEEEVLTLTESGCIAISEAHLNDLLAEIGYHVDKNESFNYINSSNENTYPAKSVCIKDENGLNFSNIYANRDNLKRLQQIRLDVFVLANNRIWEL